MRNLVTLFLIGSVMSSWAVDLRVHGQVTMYGTQTQMADVLVRVYRDGVKEQAFLTGPGGKYTVELARGGKYVVRFSRPGHVTKCFAVDTKGAAWQGDNKEVSVSVEMILFEQVPGLDLSFFDLPMGMARFSATTGYLTWDKEYEDRIKPEVDRLMAEVRMRDARFVEAAGPTSSAARNLGHSGSAFGGKR